VEQNPKTQKTSNSSRKTCGNAGLWKAVDIYGKHGFPQPTTPSHSPWKTRFTLLVSLIHDEFPSFPQVLLSSVIYLPKNENRKPMNSYNKKAF